MAENAACSNKFSGKNPVSLHILAQFHTAFPARITFVSRLFGMHWARIALLCGRFGGLRIGFWLACFRIAASQGRGRDQ